MTSSISRGLKQSQKRILNFNYNFICIKQDVCSITDRPTSKDFNLQILLKEIQI